MEYDISVTFFAPKSVASDRYEFLYMRLKELKNALLEKYNHQFKWKVYLGKELAEIHHVSHTWCFCDYDFEMKRINESKEPVYLGSMGLNEFLLKVWQDNDLKPNEAVVEGTTLDKHVYKAKLILHSEV